MLAMNRFSVKAFAAANTKSRQGKEIGRTAVGAAGASMI
jgi:hypothetical protein